MDKKKFKRIDVDSCVDEKTETLVIPEGIEEIAEPLGFEYGEFGGLVFENPIPVKKWKKVILPSTLKKIGDEAFCDCEIEEIKLPDSVQYIGKSAFRDNWELKEVTIPKNVETIGESAFENCRGLMKITLPNNLSEISERAFNTCINLESLYLPDTIRKIGKQAFTNCVGLKTLVIPKFIKEIGLSAFYNVPLVGVYEGSYGDQYCKYNLVNSYIYSTNSKNSENCFTIVDALKTNSCDYNNIEDEYIIDELKIPDEYSQLCLYCYDNEDYEFSSIRINTLFIPSSIKSFKISVDVNLIVYDDSLADIIPENGEYNFVPKSEYEKGNY